VELTRQQTLNVELPGANTINCQNLANGWHRLDWIAEKIDREADAIACCLVWRIQAMVASIKKDDPQACDTVQALSFKQADARCPRRVSGTRQTDEDHLKLPLHSDGKHG
jgi:hypothetical protein